MKKGKITKEQLLNPYKEDILNKYQNRDSIKELSSFYKVDPRTISSFLKENGIESIRKGSPKRKYTLDESVFENIDSEEKSYVLGFLYADGCITKNNSQLKITVSSIDEDILIKIKNLLKTNAPIRQKEGGIIKGTSYFGKPTSTLVIDSVKICKDLNKWGVFQRKTLHLIFPSFLSKELIRHFIRRYFDGDGCITSSRGRTKVSLVGNYEFVRQIQNFIDEETNFSHLYQRKNSEIFSFEICAKDGVEKFLDVLYKDSQFSLNRKYERYIKHCQNIPFNNYK